MKDRKKKKKREKGIWTGAMRGERFLLTWKPCPRWRDQWGQRTGSGVSESNGETDPHRWSVLPPGPPQSEMLIHAGRWGPRLRLQREDWGEDWGWLCAQPKGTRMPHAPAKGVRE